MTRDEWQRAEPVLTHARLLPDREREALLQTVVLEDALRRDIMEMFRRGPAGSPSLAVAGHLPTPPASAHTALPALPALAPGSSLANGRYVVVRQIGRGGMGAVFLGHDTMFGTLVALKAVPYDERLLTEARRAAVCSDHPHVATIHNVLQERISEQDVGVLVMEYVAGTPASRLLDEGPVDVGRVLKWGRQIAAAVAHAHEHQVLHCDLKPENIVITSDGRAKVLDFGISRATFDAGDAKEPVRGTMPYMAPEQLLSKQFLPAGDIYSLGVTLFELVTGRLPFEGDDDDLLRLRIVGAPPPDASEIAVDVPPELQRVLERAMAKQPEKRFRSARSFEHALEAVEAGVQYTSGSVTVPVRANHVPSAAPAALSVWSKIGIAAVSLTALAVGMTAIGALTSAIFNMTMGRSGFDTETVVDWFVWGRRASFMPFLWVVILVVGLVPLALTRKVALSLSARAKQFDASVATALRSFCSRHRLDDPSTAAAYLLVFFGAAIALSCIYFWPLISAMLDFVSMATEEQLEALADDPTRRWLHSFYRGTFTTIVMGMVGAWWALFSATRSEPRLSRSLVVGGAAMMVVALVLLHAPYRLISYKHEFEVVAWNKERCYVFGENAEEVLLFCPQRPTLRNEKVKKTAPGLQRDGKTDTDPFRTFVKQRKG